MEPYFCSTYTLSQPEEGNNLLHPFSLRHCKGLYGAKAVRSSNKQTNKQTNPLISGLSDTGKCFKPISSFTDSQNYLDTHIVVSSAAHTIQVTYKWGQYGPNNSYPALFYVCDFCLIFTTLSESPDDREAQSSGRMINMLKWEDFDTTVTISEVFSQHYLEIFSKVKVTRQEMYV